MKALHGNAGYDFFFTQREGLALLSSPLEVDLLDAETKKPTGKKITLKFENPQFGDAQLDMVPKETSWDDASSMTVTARMRYLTEAMANENSQARLGYRDVYFHLYDEKDLVD